jgi:hypothetical protein
MHQMLRAPNVDWSVEEDWKRNSKLSEEMDSQDTPEGVPQ